MTAIPAKQHPEKAVWCIKDAWQQREEFASQLRVPVLIAQLLYNRGVMEFDQARRFLQPSLNDLIEPQRLNGLAAAVRRVRQAMSKGEKIVLYGDYDVDGITGVAILWRCLKMAGGEVDYYVPHRIEEGYGLNTEAIRLLAEKGTQLIVTVDCGIAGIESANLAAQLGVDMIITDHHKIEGELPRAVAIVHPNLPGQDYPNKDLCGAGVAFKLAWGLAQEFSGAQKVSAEFREYLLNVTALVSLGTIADVVPLQGENRILAVFGMQALINSVDQGIMAIMKAAGLQSGKLLSSDVAYRLAPRLNAAGRMGHARLAVELLTKSTDKRSAEIANYLENQNRQRQKVEKQITAEALEQVKALGMNKKGWRGIVVAGENWHGGVVGIVASRIVDKYQRPTVVISLQGDKAMGSCRSVAGFDMYRALASCESCLESYGGHAMAAGITMDPGKIEWFREAFNQYACNHLSDNDLMVKIEADAEVKIQDLDVATVGQMERLGPFGSGNPEVRLIARGLRLVGPPRCIGQKGEHLQITVAAKDNAEAHLKVGGVMRAVAFGKAAWEKKLIDAASFDLLFEPVINRFNGNPTAEMMVQDIQIVD